MQKVVGVLTCPKFCLTAPSGGYHRAIYMSSNAACGFPALRSPVCFAPTRESMSFPMHGTSTKTLKFPDCLSRVHNFLTYFNHSRLEQCRGFQWVT